MSRKNEYRILLLYFLIFVTLISCVQDKAVNFTDLKGAYFGQNPPEITPEIFAPGIISTGYSEQQIAFTPDGRELFLWLGENRPYCTILWTKEAGAGWNPLQVASFSGKYVDMKFSFSPDGRTFLFSSNRPHEMSGNPTNNLDIWTMERSPSGWGEPKRFGLSVNGDSHDYYPSMAENGNLYFMSDREGGLGEDDIYYACFKDGKLIKARNIGPPINTSLNEGDPFIARDESYILFCSRDRKDGFGNNDLFISYRKNDGTWTTPKNFGNEINTAAEEVCPMVSYDGKYLFFSSNRKLNDTYPAIPLTLDQIKKALANPGNGDYDIYWMDAGIIEELRSKINRKTNSPSPSEYVIKTYESDFEKKHKKIGLEVSKNWAWPFEGFTEIYSDPNFDPETALSCFKDDEMVGFVSVRLMGEGPGILINEGMAAYLDIPRVLPGFEEAADLLLKKIIHTLKDKGVKLIRTRASTMRKNSIELAKRWGFKPHEDYPLGYKIYYTYDLIKGKLNYPTNDLQSFDRERDLEDCSKGVSNYFRMPKERAKDWILGFESREDIISHYVIRENGKLAGYCIAFSNPHNKDIIATYYIEATNEDYMKQLIVQTVNNCIERNKKLYLIDIIGYLFKYEKLVVSLGFDNAATWGIFELKLD